MKLSQIYIKMFTTNNPTTGSPYTADRLPQITVFKNGEINNDIEMKVTEVSANPSTDGGVYKIVANISWSDAGFSVDDEINIYVFTIINSIESHAFIDSFILDNGSIMAPAGLDNISITEPSGRASTFREMIVQLYARFFNKVTLDNNHLKVYKNNNSVNTTQNVSDSGTTQTVEKA